MRSGFGGLLIAPLLAGCAGGSSLFGSTEAAQETGMAGRWILTAPDAPSCGVNFSAAPGAEHGLLNPEGGCPAGIFAGRRWALADGMLTVTSEAGESLARFRFAGDRFAGQSAGGVPLTLTRERQ